MALQSRTGTWSYTSAYEWSRPINYRVEPVWPGTKSKRKAKPGLTLKVVEQLLEETLAVQWIKIRRCGWLPVKIGPKTMVVDEAPPSAAAVTSAAGVCRSGHPLVSYATPTAGYGCDGCGRKYPQAAELHGCRACNFDLCTACVGGSSSNGGRSTARGASSPSPMCRSGHPLVLYATPTKGYGCDGCGSKFPQGTSLHGCRACNYDLCGSCAAASGGSSAARTASPLRSASQGGSRSAAERATAARRIAQRKREEDARAAKLAQAAERTARALAAAKEQRQVAAASEAVRQREASARAAAEATQQRVSAQRAAAKAAKEEALRKGRAAAAVNAKAAKAKAAAARAAAQASRSAANSPPSSGRPTAAKVLSVDGIIHRNLHEESHRRSSYDGRNRRFSVSSAGKSLFLQSLGTGGAGGRKTEWTAEAIRTGAWDGSGGTGTSWNSSEGKGSARYHAENPQIEINVKKSGNGKLAISVTQHDRKDGGDFFFVLYRLSEDAMPGRRLTKLPVAKSAAFKSTFYGGKTKVAGECSGVSPGLYLLSLCRDTPTVGIQFTAKVSLPKGAIAVRVHSTASEILAAERAEPTESCHDILAPLRYRRDAPFLLKSDPLPDILERCTRNRTHFKDALFDADNTRESCGAAYVKAPKKGYTDGRVMSWRRASDHCAAPELFDDTIDPDDILQVRRCLSRCLSRAQLSSFIYHYILRESCSQFDSLPLTSLTISPPPFPCATSLSLAPAPSHPPILLSSHFLLSLRTADRARSATAGSSPQSLHSRVRAPRLCAQCSATRPTTIPSRTRWASIVCDYGTLLRWIGAL
jgi:hypothetical protein